MDFNYNPFALRPENEEAAKILDAATRARFSEWERRQEIRRVAKANDDRYSLTRLLNAMRNDRVQADAPFEYQVSQRIAEQVGREPHMNYYYVPVDGRRDLTVATPSAGGHLSQTDVGPGNTFTHFLDIFFPYQRLGITRLSLQRPATIPRMTGTVTTTWLVNEGSTISESQFVFAISSTTPKTVGAYCEISGQLLKQTSTFAQTFVFQALARAVAAELSRKLLTGASPNGETLGVFNTPGVGSLAGGSANLSKVLDTVQTVETANGLLQPEAAGFVTTPGVARLMRGRESVAGSGLFMTGNNLASYPCVVTGGASPNLMVFADWSQLLLLEYNVLEISSDPYGANSSLFKSGIVGVRVLWTVDSILLNPPSFVTTGTLN